MEWRLNHVGQMAQSVQDYSVTKKNQKDKQEVIKNDLLFVQVRAIVRLHINYYSIKVLFFF